ncbi:hypothetical protein GCM10027445_58360 [Amycolatopsis endophytica]
MPNRSAAATSRVAAAISRGVTTEARTIRLIPTDEAYLAESVFQRVERNYRGTGWATSSAHSPSGRNGLTHSGESTVRSSASRSSPSNGKE